MTEGPIPLPVWPRGITAERMELLKQAKATLNSPIRILPVPADYGSPHRVLCFGEMPPFVAKTVPIRPENVSSVDSIAKALQFWLDPWADPHQFAEEFWLGSVMGCDVKYHHSEDQTGKVYYD